MRKNPFLIMILILSLGLSNGCKKQSSPERKYEILGMNVSEEVLRQAIKSETISLTYTHKPRWINPIKYSVDGVKPINPIGTVRK